MKEQEYLHLHVEGLNRPNFIVSSLFRSSCGNITDGISFGLGVLSKAEAIKLKNWLTEKLEQDDKGNNQ